MSTEPGQPSLPRGEMFVGDVSCAECGYSLRGLPISGKCPECGMLKVGAVGASRSRLGDPEKFGKPLIEAPEWYLRLLQLAFLLMTVAWVATPVSMVFVWMGLSLGVVPANVLSILFMSFWSAGVMITLLDRPLCVRGKINGEPITEVPRLRLMVALAQIPFVLVPVFAYVLTVVANPGLFQVLLTLCLVGAIAGYIPTMVYFAQLADWAHDDELSGKLRANGWLVGISLFGLLSLYAAIELQGVIPIIPFIAGLFWLLIVVVFILSMVLIAISTVRLWSMSHWLLVNRRSLADRDHRMVEKAAREAAGMGSHAPLAPPMADVDQHLYDSIIEKNERNTAPDQAPTSTPDGTTYSHERRLEKKGDNPYALEDGDA